MMSMMQQPLSGVLAVVFFAAAGLAMALMFWRDFGGGRNRSAGCVKWYRAVHRVAMVTGITCYVLLLISGLQNDAVAQSRPVAKSHHLISPDDEDIDMNATEEVMPWHS